jgi:hypothetical protein
MHTYTDLREEINNLRTRLRVVELKSSLEEVVARSLIQYSKSQRTASDKRRNLKQKLKGAYKCKGGKTDGCA